MQATTLHPFPFLLLLPNKFTHVEISICIATVFTSLLTPHPKLTPRPQRAAGASPGSSVRTEFHRPKARVASLMKCQGLSHVWSPFTELQIWLKVTTLQVESYMFLTFSSIQFSTLIQFCENARTHRHSHSFLWGPALESSLDCLSHANTGHRDCQRFMSNKKKHLSH